MSTIKEYEAIYETFNKYAKEFQENPKTTKQIDPKFVKLEKKDLKKGIEEKEKKNLSEFKNINKSNPKEQSDLKPKIEKLIENWNRVISKLENLKAPNKVQESAKSLKRDLVDHLKSQQKSKTNFNQEKRNQILEKLKQGKERNIGIDR